MKSQKFEHVVITKWCVYVNFERVLRDIQKNVLLIASFNSSILLRSPKSYFAEQNFEQQPAGNWMLS